ncbi:MAG: bifunctional phosphopantothenoylcysteine decarboxylase/phosphopantothenate--cysteine ligase CoaBC [Nitrospirae bacterium]|nr:bifunctional phosphopantothenoylcysteine decarboxylase/phosphopantothenate--cysteine ligase CoaBC [Nitrospirota bacterium]
MSFSAAKRKRNLQLTNLKNRSVLLGVSGGIAAYKAAELVRRLKDKGASVTVMMTGAAQQFITPLSLQVASGNTVYTSLFQEPLTHISVPAAADIMVVAPATANIIGKFANGIADDILSTAFLAFRGPVVIAPSMNEKMFEHPVVQDNLKKLRSLGVIQTGPDSGPLACGEEGTGRLAEVQDIVAAVVAALTPKDLKGQKIVVTAGPTREYLDPVRFISNRSSGKMGFSLARAARNRGAEVVLISGPTSLECPQGVTCRRVDTSAQMLSAVREETDKGVSALIMAAAVADFRPARPSKGKVEKKKLLSLSLTCTEDIVSCIAQEKKRPFIIGFAAETGKKIDRAREKMKRKKMDMIVFNDVTEKGAGFETDTNRVVIIDKAGFIQSKLMSKDDVADAILDRYLNGKT